MTIETDRQGLLDAIAAAGTRGAEAFKNSQAALAAQQQEATRLALASGVQGGAPQGAQDEIARIIGQGYQPRQAQLTSNQATMTDYYSRLGANANTYMGQAQALIPAINQQFENQLALQMAGGGGGSGGGGGGRGGGGGGSSKEVDAFSQLLKDYHGITNLKKAIPELAVGQDMEVADVAEGLGVPPALASAWFPRYLPTGLKTVAGLAGKKNPPSVRSVRKQAMQGARSTPGNQLAQRKQIVQTYKKTVQQQQQQKKQAKKKH